MEQTLLEVEIKKLHEDLGDNIIPLQKSIPPFMKFDKGYGYQGITLYDRETKKIQCHYCGKWYKSLAAHIRIHAITAKEYKGEVGLYNSEPLMGLETAKLFREQGKRAYEAGNVPTQDLIPHANKKSANPNSSDRIAFKNRYGTCDAQLRFRWNQLVEKLGRTPTRKECAFNNTLIRRYGSWQEAKEIISSPEKN